MVPAALALLVFASDCLAHGSSKPAPPPVELPPPKRPSRPPPPQPPPPPPPPPPPSDPGHPTPVTPKDTPPPPSPETPPEEGTRTVPRKPIRYRPPASRSHGAWRVWWEYNREHLIGVRALLRASSPITGRGSDRRDPLGGNRARVLAALRKQAARGNDRGVRSAALMALGRMGTDDDGRMIVRMLHRGRQPRGVQEAAAVALGILPAFTDRETRQGAHAYLRYASQQRRVLPTRARGLILLATGLRARHDPALVMFLVGEIAGSRIEKEEAANLALACGLAGDPLSVPELLHAARKGRLGGRELSVVGRAHATQALALIGDPGAPRVLSALLASRSADVQVRRSAALALGRVLRERDVSKDDQLRAKKVLLNSLAKDRDSVVRGFAAVAMGGARQPLGLAQMREAIDHGGNFDLKPFCALALGLAARTRSDDKLRAFLLEELEKTKELELSSALAIALGLARAEKARDALHERLLKKSLPATARGAAAQGLGLLKATAPEVVKTLEQLAFSGRDPSLTEDVVLALGMMGRRSVALPLTELLSKTKSSLLQARIILALGHLDHEASVEPLLDIFENNKARPLLREFAAVALGMMGDRREEDLLFAIDAFFNFYATTVASHELIRLY